LLRQLVSLAGEFDLGENIYLVGVSMSNHYSLSNIALQNAFLKQTPLFPFILRWRYFRVHSINMVNTVCVCVCVCVCVFVFVCWQGLLSVRDVTSGRPPC